MWSFWFELVVVRGLTATQFEYVILIPKLYPIKTDLKKVALPTECR